MTDTTLTVKNDLVVSLEYTLKLDNGQAIDSSIGREPLDFLQGHGQIIPGLEQSLYGMAVNDEKSVVIAPIDGYGEPNPENFELVPKNTFPQDMELAEGMVLSIRDTNSGQIFQAHIVEIRSDSVLLDLNHPLAGETLYFDVKIIALRQATNEELAHGHVHTSQHGH
jgi:FKBP-type peptidyl-prolyl cis-trans isomerase SlyD